MTVLQRLILEAGTALIVVLAAYALLPVILLVMNGEVPKKTSSVSSADSFPKGEALEKEERE